MDRFEKAGLLIWTDDPVKTEEKLQTPTTTALNAEAIPNADPEQIEDGMADGLLRTAEISSKRPSQSALHPPAPRAITCAVPALSQTNQQPLPQRRQVSRDLIGSEYALFRCVQ